MSKLFRRFSRMYVEGVVCDTRVETCRIKTQRGHTYTSFDRPYVKVFFENREYILENFYVSERCFPGDKVCGFIFPKKNKIFITRNKSICR